VLQTEREKQSGAARCPRRAQNQENKIRWKTCIPSQSTTHLRVHCDYLSWGIKAPLSPFTFLTPHHFVYSQIQKGTPDGQMTALLLKRSSLLCHDPVFQKRAKCKLCLRRDLLPATNPTWKRNMLPRAAVATALQVSLNILKVSNRKAKRIMSHRPPVPLDNRPAPSLVHLPSSKRATKAPPPSYPFLPTYSLLYKSKSLSSYTP
jgi:hypothetical protein